MDKKLTYINEKRIRNISTVPLATTVPISSNLNATTETRNTNKAEAQLLTNHIQPDNCQSSPEAEPAHHLEEDKIIKQAKEISEKKQATNKQLQQSLSKLVHIQIQSKPNPNQKTNPILNHRNT